MLMMAYNALLQLFSSGSFFVLVSGVELIKILGARVIVSLTNQST
jgi:hypothetical protein